MTLLDVTTLAEVMALSRDVDDGAGGYGNYWPQEVAGYRMLNAAGLTLVSDPTSFNKVRHLRLGAAPNPGENGYGFGNLVTLFPADIYVGFCCWAVMRKMESGACYGGTAELYTADYFEGLAFSRDQWTGTIRLTSYLNQQLSGDFLSPLTGPTNYYTDLILIQQSWRLTNPTPINLGKAMLYDVAINVTVKVNGVASPIRSLTGRVRSARFEQNAALGLAPWHFLTGQSFGDGAAEIHGWGFKV